MIEHYFDKHDAEDLEEMEFGMRILRTTRTAHYEIIIAKPQFS